MCLTSIDYSATLPKSGWMYKCFTEQFKSGKLDAWLYGPVRGYARGRWYKSDGGYGFHGFSTLAGAKAYDSDAVILRVQFRTANAVGSMKNYPALTAQKMLIPKSARNLNPRRRS